MRCRTPLSSGQLQMLAIARAIISRNSIVIMDEGEYSADMVYCRLFRDKLADLVLAATASLDAETARATEEMMRHELRSCTVISITHSIASAVCSTFPRASFASYSFTFRLHLTGSSSWARDSS